MTDLAHYRQLLVGKWLAEHVLAEVLIEDGYVFLSVQDTAIIMAWTVV